MKNLGWGWEENAVVQRGSSLEGRGVVDDVVEILRGGRFTTGALLSIDDRRRELLLRKASTLTNRGVSGRSKGRLGRIAVGLIFK